MSDKNPHFGSSFEDFLKEEGIAEEVNAAINDVLAWRFTKEMQRQGSTRPRGTAARGARR